MPGPRLQIQTAAIHGGGGAGEVRHFLQFPAISRNILAIAFCLSTLRVGALCVPCAESCSLRLRDVWLGTAKIFPQFSRNFPAISCVFPQFSTMFCPPSHNMPYVGGSPRSAGVGPQKLHQCMEPWEPGKGKGFGGGHACPTTVFRWRKN